MGAGLMQLVLIGKLSQFITQNPQINYYKYSHNYHQTEGLWNSYAP